MSGLLKIDGIDIQTEYGLYLLEGYINEVLRYPALKSPEVNDWHEEDGIEVDLSTPALEAKEINLTFLSRSQTALPEFLTAMGEGEHSCEFLELGATLDLRVAGSGNYNNAGFYRCEIKFSQDLPMAEYEYQAPLSSLPDQGYEIDAMDIAEYGMIFLSGTKAALDKPAMFKPNLTIDLAGRTGVIYDSLTAKLQSKEVTLPCLMRASTVAQFMANYNALLFDLVRSGERILTMPGGQLLPFYYKSATVEDALLGVDGWCKFSLTIVITKP